ncbi:putative nuclease HARBI1 [Rhagoletis pomonella]|uniref:putative nuclease HARBI1 n=1 Tax=Rhagoletis pomonella TaxID=28610 RepID=UPI001784DE39|nr:putative nuclease HARBI1 [Rhagoletis pomonella]
MKDRNGTFWERDVPLMDENRFKENFRVKRNAFRIICEKVRGIEKVDINMRPYIPLHKRVAISLFALGSAAEYRTVASLFGVGRSTVGEIVLDFCQAVCENFSDCINSYPQNLQEIRKVVAGFARLGFPQCFGALDGCHIEVQPSKEEAVDYYNYKGWYSVVLLASCDHRSKFTYINIGSTGKNNDSYIFESSTLKRLHEVAEIFTLNSTSINGVNVPVLLIGDSAFRLSRYMMKPFPYSPNQPAIQKTFNYRLSRCRRVIENAFGQLKARFRKIGRGLQVAPKNVNIIIRTCCILHNFLKMENDEVSMSWIQDSRENITARSQPSHTTRLGENNVSAAAIRNAIAWSFRSKRIPSVIDPLQSDKSRIDNLVVALVEPKGPSSGKYSKPTPLFLDFSPSQTFTHAKYL